MSREEAIAWLAGERSMINNISQDPFDTWAVRTAQADAAMIQAAYWVLKAYSEGLIPEEIILDAAKGESDVR